MTSPSGTSTQAKPKPKPKPKAKPATDNHTDEAIFEDNCIFSLVADPAYPGNTPLETALITTLGRQRLLDWNQFVHTTLVALLRQDASAEHSAVQERYMKGVIRFIGHKMPVVVSIHAKWAPTIKQFLDERASQQPEMKSEKSRIEMERMLATSLYYGTHFETKFAATLCWQANLARWLQTPADYELLGMVFDDGLVREWATCDAISTRITSKTIAAQMLLDTRNATSQYMDLVAAVFEPWALEPSHNLWKRRVACVTFVNAAPKADNQLRDVLTRMATSVVQSPERFHQTGVGWLMRQLSVSHRSHVVGWIETVALKHLSAEGLRYA
eukprot:jgi/Hompol1/4866/HPOL_003956-RA